ncbi:MAG TPA: hypothetical protein VIU82_03275 [Bosea sp. (in: a-proteobacteria)]
MFVDLVVCNILGGLVVALGFRAIAIVLAAPIMAALNMAVLIGGGYGVPFALLGTTLCLFIGQFTFLVGTALVTWPSIGCMGSQRQRLDKRFKN